MSVLLLNMDRGMSTATDTMSELGITADDLAGSSQTERFKKFADAIAAIEDPARRTAMAVQVFGKSGTQLLPLIVGGGAAFQKLADESDALGATVTRLQADVGAALTDAFNRVTVAVDGVFRGIGTELGPAITRMATGLAHTIAIAGQYARQMVTIGAAILAATAAMKAITIATWAFSKASIAVQALAGPKAWFKIAAGLLAAAGAAALMDNAISGMTSDVESAIAAAEQAVAAVDDLGGAAAEAAPALQNLLTPEQKTGFADRLQSVTDQIQILRGTATETSLELDRMLQAGVGAGDVLELDRRIKLMERLKAQQEQQRTAAEQFKAAQEQAQQEQSAAMMAGFDKAQGFLDSIKTPAEQMTDIRNQVDDLLQGGFLSEAEAANIIAGKEKGLTPEREQQSPGFMQKGSSEALAAVFKSMGGQSPQVKEQQKGNKILGSIDKKLSTRDAAREQRFAASHPFAAFTLQDAI